MKPKSHSFLPLISIVAISMVHTVAAATGTWTGAVDNLWDTSAINWSGVAGVPWDITNGPGNTATFSTLNVTAEVITPVYVNGITFSLNGTLIESFINLVGTTPTIAVTTGQTGTISSNVAGAAGLIKSDTGLLSLSNATYTGGTTVSGGRLKLMNTMTGSANFTTNAELEFNLTTGDQQPNSGTFSGTGNLIKTGGSTLILGNFGGAQTVALTGSSSIVEVQSGLLQVFYAFNNVPTNSWTGNEAGITVASGATFDMRNGNIFADELSGSGTITKGGFDIGNNVLTIGVKDGSGTFSGTIQDADITANLTLVKQGTGTQTLNGTTTYRGGTTVNGGRLVLQNTQTGSTNYTTNAELEFNLTTGGRQFSNGTISGTGKFIKTGTDGLILGNFGGPQTVALTGSSSVVEVQSGLLQVFYAFNNVPTNSWTGNEAGITVASGATFDMRNGNIFADELNGSGTITKGGFDIGNNVLTIGVMNGSGTFSGTLQDANFNATLTLVKQGTGTQTLNGTTTYRGGTTVTGGRLTLVNSISGGSNFVTNAELEFNITAGDQNANGGTISGSGKLLKTGAGTVQLGNNGSPQTIALTSGALIDVQGGALRNEYGNSAWSTNKADVNVATGAFFDIWDGDTTVDALTGSGTINKGWSANNSLTFGADNGSGTFSGPITQGAQSYGGQNGGSFSLIKVGTGTQTFTGANTYIGTTTVSAGTLALVGGSQASPITVSGGASLGFTLGSPTTSTSSFDVTLGTIKITGTPNLASHTLITASSGITGTPVLHTAIPGYALAVDGNSLKLVQTGGSGYTTWAATNAPTGTSANDFDGDGVANGVEYVLGGTKDTKDLGKLPQVSASGANMVVTFNRDQSSINGTTTVAIQVGTNLVTWPDSYNVPGPALANNPGVTVTKDTSPGFDTITLTIPRTPDPTKFARLNVTTN